jgi:hypothetical protein
LPRFPDETRTKAMSKIKKKSPSPAQLSAEDHAPIQEQISIRAYELWQQSDCVQGNDKARWLQAEPEIIEWQN